MNVLYYSKPFYLDCDLPLIKQFQTIGIDVYYVIDLPSYCLKSTLLEIKEQRQKTSVISAEEYQEFSFLGEYIDLNKVLIVNRPIRNPLNVENIKVFFELQKLVGEINPDVIHISEPLTVAEFPLYTFTNKILLTVHDPFPHTGEKSITRTIYRRLAFQRLKKFVLLNKKQVCNFSKQFRINPNKIFTNRLGIYDSYRLFDSNVGAPDYKYLLFFGRISPYKGVKYLLEAFMKIYNEYENFHLIIAGKGDFDFDISEYERKDRIHIVNRFISPKEIVSYIKGARGVVCPYTDATQSGVVMTSFAFRTPVIASNVGGFKEVISHNKTGLLVEPKNIEELSLALSQFMSKNFYEHDFSNNIYNCFFEGENSWNEIAKKYLEIYNK